MDVMAHKGRGPSHRVNLWDYDPDTAQRLSDLEKMREEARAKIREFDAQEAAILDAFRKQYAAA